MRFKGDPRWRSIALYACAGLLIVVALGGLQAFDTTHVGFLNPETAGETMLSAGLIVLVFLLLLLLLVLLLRDTLKIYAGQGSSGLGARLRSRMVLGAVLIALAPVVLMFLFSFLLMNRSLDRWFSPNTTELRDDSIRVVQELAQYVTSNARGEAESIAATGAADKNLPALQDVLNSRRITLDGGFAIVYGEDGRAIASFQAPPESSPATLLPWLDEGEQEKAVAFRGPFSANLLAAARRSDEPVIDVTGGEYALGFASTASGKAIVTALPMPQGLSQTAKRIRSGSATYWALFHMRNQFRTWYFLVLLVMTVLALFLSVWVARFLSNQITRPVEALGVAMAEIAKGKYDHRVELTATGEMGELVRAFNHMATDLDTSRQLAESSSA
ncbi:MAG: HAMP domain-containing protein, partial [Terracidiphilus sp.]